MDVFDYYLSAIKKFKELDFQNTPRKRAITLEALNEFGRKLPDTETYDNLNKLIKPIVIDYLPRTKREFIAEFLLENYLDLANNLRRKFDTDEFILNFYSLYTGSDIIQLSMIYEKLIDHLGMDQISDFWVEDTLEDLCDRGEINLKELLFLAMFSADNGKIDDCDIRSTKQKKEYENIIQSLKLNLSVFNDTANRARTHSFIGYSLFFIYWILFIIHSTYFDDSRAYPIFSVIMFLIPLLGLAIVYVYEKISSHIP